MIDKINCFAVLKDHLETLKNNDTGRTSVGDLVVFYVIPIIASVILVRIFTPGESLSNVLVTALSIFAALLFNVLLLVLEQIRRTQGSTASNKERIKLLLEQTYSNIAYSILVCLLALVVLIVPYLYDLKAKPLPQAIVWGIIYFLLINFLLTLLMILKRMHVSISKEIAAHA